MVFNNAMAKAAAVNEECEKDLGLQQLLVLNSIVIWLGAKKISKVCMHESYCCWRAHIRSYKGPQS